MRQRRQRSQQGFTLIELMTVVAIIAILTVVLVGASNGTGAGTPRTTADRVTGMIQFARLRAQAQRKNHRVLVQNNAVFVFEATTTGFAGNTFTDIVQSMDIPSGVVVWNAEVPVRATSGQNPTQNASLVFNIDMRPDGSSTGGTVYLTDAKMQTGSDRFRVFVYKTTGSALSREVW